MSRRKRKILLSARDPGAAGSIQVLYKLFANDEHFDAFLTASGEALSSYQNQGIPVIPFAFNGSHFVNTAQEASVLLSKANNLFKKISPDLIITSTSSFGIGIDEALLAVANVPKYSFQDFWGDVNLSLDNPADLYFVLDDFAVELTEKRWGIKAIATGSPKYTKYSAKNIPAIKKATRLQLGLNDQVRILSWFGQSPSIPGHEQIFENLLSSLTNLRDDKSLNFFFVQKEHPKFKEMHGEHLKKIDNLGISFHDVTNELDVEKWLIAADLMLTPFSLTGLDHAYLSSYSDQPIGTVIYLMNNTEIRKFAYQTCGIEKFPIVDQGIGKYFDCGDADSLSQTIKFSLMQTELQRYHKQSKKIINKFDFTKFKHLLMNLI